MVTVANAHDDLIHDAVLDYYGKRLATCSSDKKIKIFEIEGTENYKLSTTLTGHEGPVWQVSWAHPKFGSILASCSYDGKAFIWKETPETQTWSIIAEHTVHQASVNSVSWAPHELGAVLLCTSSDGKVSVVDFNEDGTTSHVIFNAHNIGVNSASWAPISNVSSKDPQTLKQHRRFVTCGSDNLAKIWKYDSVHNTYVEEARLEGHTDWVRDVDWSPSILVRSYIATASQDRTVLIWTQDRDGHWQKQLLTEEKFPDVCWRCSWSLSGNILAVSGGDNKVSLWKENLQGKWESAGEVDQ
ncbi:protein transport protein SEC13 [Spathaspora passalidarum NRRL Y-27907]|uniref:Protein transport protein SEC13 n=1 Tax=Spathaspora passalidarum (strain NRRL Y-27907 / 11-Y1) TaxID=619300 RepID=G3AQJ7_SPAPN|nr:protein transport protein SEC13 [Spathaspora passalidarum NRRL Y-27907]EGW31545.1 protein transport protein SEC13 [Spathaspora passalidarum NRRL Y-27907]